MQNGTLFGARIGKKDATQLAYAIKKTLKKFVATLGYCCLMQTRGNHYLFVLTGAIEMTWSAAVQQRLFRWHSLKVME